MIWQNNYNQRSEQLCWNAVFYFFENIYCFIGFYFCVCSVHSNFVHHALVLIFILFVLVQEFWGQRIFTSQQQSPCACHRYHTDNLRSTKYPLGRKLMVKLLLPSAPHQGFSQERETPSVQIQTDFVELNLSHTPRTPSQQSFGSAQTQSLAQAPRVEPGDSCAIASLQGTAGTAQGMLPS